MLRLEIEALQNAEYDLNLIGFEDEELARLLAAQEAAEGLTDEDAVPKVDESVISQPGDLWPSRDHRLACGDATVPTDVDHLFGGVSADLIFTDPPYNVDYEGYTEERLKIKGDRMTAGQFQQFLHATFSNYRHVVKPGASLYVCHSSSRQREFQSAMESAGFEVRCQIIWAKNTFA
jgi:DNA modification methylase